MVYVETMLVKWFGIQRTILNFFKSILACKLKHFPNPDFKHTSYKAFQIGFEICMVVNIQILVSQHATPSSLVSRQQHYGQTDHLRLSRLKRVQDDVIWAVQQGSRSTSTAGQEPKISSFQEQCNGSCIKRKWLPCCLRHRTCSFTMWWLHSQSWG